MLVVGRTGRVAVKCSDILSSYNCGPHWQTRISRQIRIRQSEVGTGGRYCLFERDARL